MFTNFIEVQVLLGVQIESDDCLDIHSGYWLQCDTLFGLRHEGLQAFDQAWLSLELSRQFIFSSPEQSVQPEGTAQLQTSSTIVVRSLTHPIPGLRSTNVQDEGKSRQEGTPATWCNTTSYVNSVRRRVSE